MFAPKAELAKNSMTTSIIRTADKLKTLTIYTEMVLNAVITPPTFSNVGLLYNNHIFKSAFQIQYIFRNFIFIFQ